MNADFFQLNLTYDAQKEVVESSRLHSSAKVIEWFPSAQTCPSIIGQDAAPQPANSDVPSPCRYPVTGSHLLVVAALHKRYRKNGVFKKIRLWFPALLQRGSGMSANKILLNDGTNVGQNGAEHDDEFLF